MTKSSGNQQQCKGEKTSKSEYLLLLQKLTKPVAVILVDMMDGHLDLYYYVLHIIKLVV